MEKMPLEKKYFFAFLFGFAGLIHLIFFVQNVSSQESTALLTLIWRSLVNYLLGVAFIFFSYAMSVFAQKKIWEKTKTTAPSLVGICVSFCLIYAFIVPLQFIIYHLLAYFTFIFRSFIILNWYFITTFATCLSLIFLEWLKAYRMVKEQEIKILSEQLQAEKFRLEALVRQIEPHFLFNSLNSIKALAIESENIQIEMLVQNLAEVYRKVLDSPVHSLVNLSQELELVESYLYVEKIRFENRLTFEIKVNLEFKNSVYIPSLCLLTLVENAIKHGVSRQIRGGNVCVHVFKDEASKLCFLVTNPGDLKKMKSPFQLRFSGLEMVKERFLSHGFSDVKVKLWAEKETVFSLITFSPSKEL